ncbi:MAG: hypothetical protein NTX23_03800 [Candidatus Bipolaricaulota bacterium]|nr:hypothetical protein [Candidatus Bipolaricaulota bacterium]
MRIHSGRGGLVLACAAIFFGIAFPVRAEPSISATFGFDHQLVRYRFAPLLVTVSNLPEPVRGQLVVRQFVGTDPATPVTLEQEIVAGRIQNGAYPVTLPAYDPILPVVVQLVDERGNVIASASESVRQSGRGLPFTVIAGAAHHVDDTESIVDVSELPADWWAYDPVSSLWLAAPLTTRAVWLGLGAWVSAGGSLVLFSGADFYQWDSPLARDLLPVTSPVLRDDAERIPMLVGSLRAGAQVLLTEGDLPLLVRFPYGAGTVSLITKRFRDLDDMDLRRIEPRIPQSRRLLSADLLAEELLNATPVLRPMYAFAPLLVVAVFATLLISCRVALKRIRSAAVLFLGLTGAIAAASGFYLNHLGHMAYQYRITTHFHVQTSFYCSTVSYALFSLEPTRVTFPQEKGAYPAEVHQVATAKSMYPLASEATATTLDVPARVRRFLRACDGQGAGFAIAIDDAVRTVRVDATAERLPIAAMIFADGYFRRFPVGQLGETVKLDDLPRLSTSAMNANETAIYTSTNDWISSLAGTWLLALSETDDLVASGELPAKVRVVDIDMVEAVAE